MTRRYRVAALTSSNNDLRLSRQSGGLAQKLGERCHGLVPWNITLVAIPTIPSDSLDATALGRGGSRSQLNSRKREAPWGKPVASAELCFGILIAAHMRLHGASPWHLPFFVQSRRAALLWARIREGQPLSHSIVEIRHGGEAMKRPIREGENNHGSTNEESSND
jgi:hypothetical protein